MEFAEKEGVDLAMALDESLFRGRQIKVCSLCPNCSAIAIALYYGQLYFTT